MKPVLKTLPNGLRVLVIPEPSALTATTLVLVGTGSLYENAKENGLSHFLEHVYFKGTETFKTAKDVAEQFEQIGAVTNAFTAPEYTGYFAKGLPQHVPTFLSVLGDMYQNATFPEIEIDKERGVIIEEINMYEDQPQQKVAETLLALMYGDQPAGRTITGPKANIARFTRTDLLAYKHKHYHPENTIVVVAGAVDAQVVYKEARAIFGALVPTRRSKKPKTRITRSGPACTVVHKAFDQAHIALGFHTVPFGHKDTYALSLLATLLGRGLSSRLAQVLREELGAAYYTSAGNDLAGDHGMFEIVAGIDISRINQILAAIAGVLRDVRTTLVCDRELKKAVEYTVGLQRMGLESSDDIAGFYGIQYMLKGSAQSPADLEKQYRSVTAADIRRVARKVFVGSNTSLAVIGPFTPSDISLAPFRTL